MNKVSFYPSNELRGEVHLRHRDRDRLPKHAALAGWAVEVLVGVVPRVDRDVAARHGARALLGRHGPLVVHSVLNSLKVVSDFGITSSSDVWIMSLIETHCANQLLFMSYETQPVWIQITGSIES